MGHDDNDDEGFKIYIAGLSCGNAMRWQTKLGGGWVRQCICVIIRHTAYGFTKRILFYV